MKKFIPLLFCIIFGFTHAQKPEHLNTESEINQEIDLAKKLSAKDLKKTIEISKNIYKHSKNIHYKKGMLESNTLLMAKYFDIGNYKKVIELSKETEKLSTETGDYEILSNTHRLRASSYTELGFNNESHKEFLKALAAAQKIKSHNYRNYQVSMIYTGLATYFAHINSPIDSVIYYEKKSLETIEKLDNSKDFIDKKYNTLALNYINLGMTNVVLQHAENAKTFFSKALDICQNKEYNINKDIETTLLNEFAWLYFDQKQYNKAIDFAKQAEQLEKHLSLPYIRRDVYEVMFKSYVETGGKEASSKYMNLYTKLNDSLVNAEKKTINTPIEHIIDEQNVLHSNSVKNILTTVSAILISLIIIAGFFWNRNHHRLHEKYKNIIESIKKEEVKIIHEINKTEIAKDSLEKHIGIANDTTNAILQKLSKFEADQKFIRKDISLSHIANSLNTNTRYLSEIIKQHKGKSFNSYINGLRIHYIIELLYKNPKYREYKISYLAEVCGFASREVFATVFKKETGFTPSFFLSKIKSEKEEAEL